jgi:uncharacterized protein (DUF1330 family)
MSAYLVAHAAVKDMDKLEEYAGQAVPMIEAAGGERLFRGRVTENLVGSHDANLCAAFRFPDRDTLQRWYDSDAYQALIPLRDAAADMTFIVVEDMPG